MSPDEPQAPRITLREKLLVFPILLSIFLSFVYALITGLPHWISGETSLYLYVANATVRNLGVRLSSSQLQWVFPSTARVYNRQMAAAHRTPNTTQLAHGARGHWIGDSRAKHVIIWYHGGGFNIPALTGHLRYFIRLIQDKEDTKDLAVFFVTYALAPKAKYPTQLIQAVEALRYIIEPTGRLPSKVILGGDSAGGNLVSAVLSHVTHRHRAVKELRLGEPLAGAVMMAPWTSLSRNSCKLGMSGNLDMIAPEALNKFAANYVGDAPADFYTDASLANSDWFRNFPVERILILAGQNERMLPNICDFVQTLQAGFGRVEFYVGEKEAHISPFINLTFRYTSPTNQGERLRQWLDETL